MSPTILIEPIPGNPGFLASIDIDVEMPMTGTGATRFAAALDLAREFVACGHPHTILAIAAALQAELDGMAFADGGIASAYRLAYERAINTVEGMA